jgi:uncharacterized hydrophobic protein (TIGR00271 family)
MAGHNQQSESTSAKEHWGAPHVYRWWRHAVVDTIDHEKVVRQIAEEGGFSAHYAFMTLMSSGIAVLGLLLSSPAVVIGAMLISPLMNPILGLGFSLATFSFTEMRRSLNALAIGSFLAVAFAALIVLASPLKEATSEILSRTRPNLFDLMVALFAAFAGTFAIIKGRGAAIVGVAIATALMPPLGVVGYGLATWNLPILGGSLALFVTNFVTIALSATIVARFYGFGAALSSHQSRVQTALLILVFVGLAVPLGVSLRKISSEALTVSQVRSFLSDQFGSASRVTQLSVDFDAKPLTVHSVVVAPQSKSTSSEHLRAALQRKLGRPITLQVDQILIDRNATTLDAQRAELQQSEAAAATAGTAKVEGDDVAKAVALAAGIDPSSVVLDRDGKRASAMAATIPDAGLQTYRLLEQRVSAAEQGWRITIVPPFQPLPVIRFASGSGVIDAAARDAILSSAWAARRWNVPAMLVPGLPANDAAPPKRPRLDQRRATAIATILRGQGIEPVAAPAAGLAFSLSPARAPPSSPPAP